MRCLMPYCKTRTMVDWCLTAYAEFVEISLTRIGIRCMYLLEVSIPHGRPKTTQKINKDRNNWSNKAGFSCLFLFARKPDQVYFNIRACMSRRSTTMTTAICIVLYTCVVTRSSTIARVCDDPCQIGLHVTLTAYTFLRPMISKICYAVWRNKNHNAFEDIRVGVP